MNSVPHVDDSRTLPRFGAFARLSIRHKVPLVASLLIMLVGVSISAAAYFEVRHTAVLGARQHVTDIANLVSAGQRTGLQVVNTTKRVAARAPIGAFVASPTAAHRAEALAAMRNDPVVSIVVTQIRDASGAVILSTDSAFATPQGDLPDAPLAVGDSGHVGRLRMLNDSLVFAVTVPIAGGSGASMVQWRRLVNAAGDGRSTQQALGANTLVGNIDGSYWTDLRKIVKAPPAAARNATEATQYSRDGDAPVMGRLIKMPGTPWLFAAEIPMATVMGPAHAFLRQILIITLCCVLVGGLAAWAFALRFTTPLLEITHAANAVAAGQRTTGIRITRADELGHLATSFDTMTAQLQDGVQRLETRVAERTNELNNTLQQLQQAQEALVRREKLAMLGQLAAGVGHELRNPLGVMSNAVYYLDVVLQPASADVRDYLRILREQVSLSTKIVSDLLDSARITPANRRAVALRSIVDAQMERIPQSERIKLDVQLNETLPDVHVDPVHIGQAVYNLLTNATQAMAEHGGTIFITGEAMGDDDVALLVQDNGPGMSQETLSRIFEPLFTTKARGIGLGLSVSRALVQANGGDISVQSEPGQGALFTIRVPAAAAVVA